ncbi:hypothetical protein CYMTET_11800 [Cymbomonas tetramitiformis]|uniref:Uncharacterized protein n=1 Tax=Cymbomonas tetramitiformis TaxID=36881 RepID=A0AAE0GMZ6_9CHLO|nr:hypothetical protein CYMTET_11800 [Cymbomonas tetramitiformis]
MIELRSFTVWRSRISFTALWLFAIVDSTSLNHHRHHLLHSKRVLLEFSAEPRCDHSLSPVANTLLNHLPICDNENSVMWGKVIFLDFSCTSTTAEKNQSNLYWMHFHMRLHKKTVPCGGTKQTLRKLEALFNRENGCGWIGRLKMPNGAKSSSAEHEEPIQPVGLTVECITNFILEAHKRHRNPNATPHTHLSSAPLSEPSRSDEGQSRPVNIWNDSEAPDLLPCRQKAEREGCSFNVVVIKRYKLKSRISAQAHKKVPLLDELVCLAPHTEYGGPGLKGMDYREVGARDNWELFEKSNARKWLSSKQVAKRYNERCYKHWVEEMFIHGACKLGLPTERVYVPVDFKHESVRGADLAVMWHLDRAWSLIKSWRKRRVPKHFLILEVGLDKDRFQHISMHLDGFKGHSLTSDQNWRIPESGWGRDGMVASLQPWKADGTRVIIAVSAWSDMNNVTTEGDRKSFHEQYRKWAQQILASAGNRSVILVRKHGWQLQGQTAEWPEVKGVTVVYPQKPLRDLMQDDCWALVTDVSGAGVEALMLGIPVISAHKGSMFYTMSTHDIAAIHSPVMADRRPWAANIAHNQWTVEELMSGQALEFYLSALPDTPKQCGFAYNYSAYT